jgi:hypothetical protein
MFKSWTFLWDALSDVDEENLPTAFELACGARRLLSDFIGKGHQAFPGFKTQKLIGPDMWK